MGYKIKYRERKGMFVVEKLIKGFIQYQTEHKKLSNNTIESYRRDILQFHKYLKDIRISSPSQVTSENVMNYNLFMQRQGKADSSITRSISTIKSFFQYLNMIKYMDNNPAKYVHMVKPVKKLPETLTSKEIELFLEQPKQEGIKGYRDKAMLELLYATGIRVTELISLNINDVNLKMCFINCLGDGGKERSIPIYPAAVSALSKYINEVRDIIAASSDEEALFLNVKGHRMTRQGFWKIVKFYKEKAKINKQITPQTLRHSFALHLLQNGANLKLIQNMLGHADISSTQVYAQLMKNRFTDVYRQYHPRARENV